MESQPTIRDEIKPGSRATRWIAAAVGGGFGIAGAGFAVAAFALHNQHWVLSPRTFYAILGLLLLYGTIMTALVKRLARGSVNPDKPTTPNSTESNEDEAEALTRRVRLLRGTDDL